MVDFSTYLLYRVASFLLALLPLRVLYSLGEFLGLGAYAIAVKYRRLAQRNLAIAFPEKHPRELRRIARRHFARLGANLLCTLKLGRMPLDRIAAHVTLINDQPLHDVLRAGRGATVVLSHLGAWEIFAQLFPRDFSYVPNGTVYQALGNRHIDAHVQRQRARAGVQLFDRRAGFHAAIELLRSGGVLGILSDQHAGDHGLWTPFFGRLASTTPLPGLLAKRTRTPVFGAAVYTTAPGRWRMEFTARIDQPDDSIEQITARMNDVLAKQIRPAPEDWFWVHNRWKTPRPNFLLTQYKRGVYVPPGMSAENLQPFRILVRGTNWLGDNVMSAPAVRALKQGRPDAHITVAVPEKLAPVWKLVPEVDEVLPLRGKSLGAAVSAMRSRPRFGVAVLFPNSMRSALEVRLAGIPRRVGYRGHNRAWLLNQIVPERPPGPVEHQVNHYLRIVQELGGPAEFVAPRTVQRTAPAAAGPIKLALAPGAEYGPAKRWLPERFAEVAAAVAQQRPIEWHLFGTAADEPTGKIVADQLGDRCVNRIGKTTVEELINELKDCSLLLTNDTGAMHLATLLGVPVVAIFGSTEHRLTGPLGENAVVIRHHVECSPCFLRECPIDFRCMHAVTAKEVTDKVLALL
jgi:heptosyltransferase II